MEVFKNVINSRNLNKFSKLKHEALLVLKERAGTSWRVLYIMIRSLHFYPRSNNKLRRRYNIILIWYLKKKKKIITAGV